MKELKKAKFGDITKRKGMNKIDGRSKSRSRRRRRKEIETPWIKPGEPSSARAQDRPTTVRPVLRQQAAGPPPVFKDGAAALSPSKSSRKERYRAVCI